MTLWSAPVETWHLRRVHPLPEAVFPTQLEESYAALKWVAAHAGEFGGDGTRIAVAGDSVGGNMTAALTLMAKDRKGPKITYQVLFIPATDATWIPTHTMNLELVASWRAHL